MSITSGLSIILALLAAYVLAELLPDYLRHYRNYRNAGDSRAEAVRWAWISMRQP